MYSLSYKNANLQIVCEIVDSLGIQKLQDKIYSDLGITLKRTMQLKFRKSKNINRINNKR